jgi:hypothetical protein
LFPFPSQQQQPLPQPSNGGSSSGLFPFESGNNSSNNNNNNTNTGSSNSSTLITTCSNVLNGSATSPATSHATTTTLLPSMIKTEGVPIQGIIGPSPNVIVATATNNSIASASPGFNSFNVFGSSSGSGNGSSGSNNSHNNPQMSLSSTVAFNTSAVLSHSEMMVLTTNGVQMGSNSSNSAVAAASSCTTSTPQGTNIPSSSSLSSGGSASASTSSPIIINGMKPFHLLQGGNIGLVAGAKMRHQSGGSVDPLLLTPSPSNSPSLATNINNVSLIEDSIQSMKELKVNEASRMDLGGAADGDQELLFRSPRSRYALFC